MELNRKQEAPTASDEVKRNVPRSQLDGPRRPTVTLGESDRNTRSNCNYTDPATIQRALLSDSDKVSHLGRQTD